MRGCQQVAIQSADRMWLSGDRPTPIVNAPDRPSLARFRLRRGTPAGTRLIGADSFPRISNPRLPSASRAFDVALPDRRASFSSFVVSMPYLISERIGDHTRSSPFRSGSFQDAKLLKRGHPVVEGNFLGDLAILDAEYGRAREPHLRPMPPAGSPAGSR